MAGMVQVINPNSSAHVTAAIDMAAVPFREQGHAVSVVSMPEGPAGIETESDIHACIAPMLAYARQHDHVGTSFIIACFADPGLYLLREQLTGPVYGIAECGVLAALRLGERFGVISLRAPAIARHLRAFGAMGMTGRLARDRAIDLGVAQLRDRDVMLERMIATGRRLRDEDGADVILMAGAAMSEVRGTLEEALDLPVVDPTQAALAMAVGFAALSGEQ